MWASRRVAKKSVENLGVYQKWNIPFIRDVAFMLSSYCGCGSASVKCRPTTTWRVRSGTLMLSSNLSSIPQETRMTLSSSKVCDVYCMFWEAKWTKGSFLVPNCSHLWWLHTWLTHNLGFDKQTSCSTYELQKNCRGVTCTYLSSNVEIWGFGVMLNNFFYYIISDWKHTSNTVPRIT